MAEAQRRLARGETLLAEQYFVSAWTRGAATREVLPGLLTICLRDQRHSAALHYVDRALREEPGEPRLIELAALLEYDIGRRESALYRLRELAETQALPTQLLYFLGELEADFGDPSSARVALEAYLEAVPGGAHRLSARRLLARLGEEDS